jgi:hypothetical protein
VKTVFGVLLLAAAAIVAFLVLASSCTSSPAKRATIRDPGPGKVADLRGPVHVTTLDAVEIGGKVVRLRSRSLSGYCTLGTDRCYGFVVVAPDGRTAERVSWWQPQSANRFSLNTNSLRFDGQSVVVEGGISIPLSARFKIRGCEVNTRQALEKSGAGATLYLDGATGTVAGAACNGTD